jgi:hypothetical protein
MRAPLFLGLLLPVLILAPAPALAQDGEEEAVRHLAETFLGALSAADTASLSTLLAPDAMIYRVVEGEGGGTIGATTREAFLSGLGGDNRSLLERMWEPTVLIQGRVAMVWTPYDFHLNGQFSHCGIDVFNLLKDQGGWKVTSITYNVIREGCPPSPLGKPGG